MNRTIEIERLTVFGLHALPQTAHRYFPSSRIGRAEDDDEQRREDEERGREEHLDRCLGRSLFGERAAAPARVVGEIAQRLAEREPELLALEQRPDERRHLRRVEPLGHALERPLAALADAEFGQDERELVRQGPFHALDEPRDRTEEANACFDRYRQQIECIGEVVADLRSARCARRPRRRLGMAKAMTPKRPASRSVAPKGWPEIAAKAGPPRRRRRRAGTGRRHRPAG